MTTHPEGARSMRSLVLASSVGTVIEWYDFFLYGSLAIFFARLFYPPGDGVAATLISVATFATGFAVRPLGSLLFGYMGDSVGRKKTFLTTLLIMGCSTAAIGLLRPLPLRDTLPPFCLFCCVLCRGLRWGGNMAGRRPMWPNIRRRRSAENGQAIFRPWRQPDLCFLWGLC